MMTRCLAAAVALVAALGVTQPASAQGYPRFPVATANPLAAHEGFQAFLAELRQAVARRDKAALERHLAGDAFFERDHGGIVRQDAGAFDNFKALFQLNEDELAAEYRDIGWHRLEDALAVHSVGAHPAGLQAWCAPGFVAPAVEEKMAKFAERLGSDYAFEWGHVPADQVNVRSRPATGAAVVGALSSEAVRVLDWQPLPGAGGRTWIKVRTPSGRTGYVVEGFVTSFVPERLCFAERDGAWKIVGYIGGGD